MGGRSDLQGTISSKKIQEILKGDFQLSEDMDKMLKKISKNGIMKWNHLELLKNYLIGNI